MGVRVTAIGPGSIHVDGYCDEIYLGSRRLDLECTKRVSLTSLNYTFLNEFPNSCLLRKSRSYRDLRQQQRDRSG